MSQESEGRVIIDFPQVLDLLTGIDGWQETDGPETSSGIEYFYKTEDEGHEAYIYIDDGWMVVNVDGDLMYEGEFQEDESLASFWRTE